MLIAGRSILSKFPPLPPLFILSILLVMTRLISFDMSHYLQQYNQEEKNLVAIEPGDAFIDVGANLGAWSTWASVKVGEKGRVLALEPNSLAYAWLARNTRKTSNVILIPAAAHSADGTMRIWTVNNSMSSTENKELIGRFMPLMSRGRLVTVRAVRVDSLASYLSPSQHVVLKIDVEGAEMEVLAGAAGLLPKVSTAIVEAHSDSLQHRVVDYLHSCGFETEISKRLVFARRAGLHRLIPDTGLLPSRD